MARRSDHTREELRELMISSARDIIAEKGLAGLTAREVAGKIGYSAGTIYNVFSNLDEIVFLIEVEVLESLELFLCSLSDNISPEKQLVEFTSRYLEFIDAHSNSWHLIVEHKAPVDTGLPEWYQEKFEGIIGLVEEKVKPILNTDDKTSIRRAARVFWAGLHGIILHSGNDKLSVTSIENRKSYAEFWVKTYIDGLKALTDRPPCEARTRDQELLSKAGM